MDALDRVEANFWIRRKRFLYRPPLATTELMALQVGGGEDQKGCEPGGGAIGFLVELLKGFVFIVRPRPAGGNPRPFERSEPS
jgi:hypothetical protein